MGYSIPKGTLIIPNLSSVLSEEGQWKFPHEFNPLNFLNDEGQFEKPEAFKLFSAGPDMCLSEGLARMELFLILACLGLCCIDSTSSGQKMQENHILYSCIWNHNHTQTIQDGIQTEADSKRDVEPGFLS
ncbi:hypothetical protein SRHO_G00117920 [Serrasalmus rhombeus]